ncbi:hypothetical protein [Streptomyces sp. NBC_00582]|uniref:hypothetical protein n=1 Tax=Streptomyces sp. NBC_00582 TaxID=2975783 RepID=UPI002E808322|nr:hypothetical protein [Streptomyces sp. NBC_00582]WUB61500.1 hypothetical protein OG852_14425 [Streptomyces sp. NBC_00582]
MTTASQTPEAQTSETAAAERRRGSLTAAAGTIAAAMKRGAGAPAEIAQSLMDVGLLFDPQTAADIAAAAYDQAHADDEAEVTEARQAEGALDWFHARYRAVQHLVFGRPDTDLMFVREILTALEPGRPDDIPPSLTWAGLVMGPSGDTPNERTLVPLNTSFGAQAFLTLTDEQRLQLGGLLVSVLHTAEGCETPGCGMAHEDLDVSDPSVEGWILVAVAGSTLGSRWWCSPLCANAAMTAGAADIAAADQDAPDEDDVARCKRCSCTDSAACAGGCAWVPNEQGIDLCSACATPAELAAAGWAVSGE